MKSGRKLEIDLEMMASCVLTKGGKQSAVFFSTTLHRGEN